MRCRASLNRTCQRVARCGRERIQYYSLGLGSAATDRVVPQANDGKQLGDYGDVHRADTLLVYFADILKCFSCLFLI